MRSVSQHNLLGIYFIESEVPTSESKKVAWKVIVGLASTVTPPYLLTSSR